MLRVFLHYTEKNIGYNLEKQYTSKVLTYKKKKPNFP